MTGGCTVEALEFDQVAFRRSRTWGSQGGRISVDPIARQLQRFREKYELKFDFASDHDRAIARPTERSKGIGTTTHERGHPGDRQGRHRPACLPAGWAPRVTPPLCWPTRRHCTTRASSKGTHRGGLVRGADSLAPRRFCRSVFEYVVETLIRSTPAPSSPTLA